MKVIEKIRSKLEERRLWKDYIATWEAEKLLGGLIGARPYFISFEEFLERNVNNRYVRKYYLETKEAMK